MNVLAELEKRSKLFLSSAGIALIGAIGFIDFLTGYEIAFAAFYVLPIYMIAWTVGREAGLAVSLASALVWLVADMSTGHLYSHPLVPIWNTLIRLAFFVIITWHVSALKRAVEREGLLARVDHLTGALNSRYFYELAQNEIDRLRRYQKPFTLAYVDLDNFKAVNDKFGHTAGDRVLQTVVSSARKHMRNTDVIARLGGDEFAFLLPETDEESARAALPKIQGGLSEAMRQQNWPITFSIGVLTCKAAPKTSDELVGMADELMYFVKRNRKNSIEYSTYLG